MARTYKRDSKGRFAGTGTAANLTTTLRGAASSRAPQRLEFLLTYHGTGTEAAKAIKAGGYRPSVNGLMGAGVYTTTKKAMGRNYARSMEDLETGYGGGGGAGRVIAHRLYRPSVVVTSDGRGGAGQPRRPGRPVRDTSLKISPVLLDKATADRTMIRSTGTVRRSRRRKR